MTRPRSGPGIPDERVTRPVFLFGPPGSGKSALGRRACAELGLAFLDLADDGRVLAALEEVVAGKTADVVAVPWAPAEGSAWLRFCRKSGEVVALWAHPLDMQARSGRLEPLFTPAPHLRTRGGFGRNGVACAEFRHLRRACEHVVLLVGLAEAEATEALVETLREIRSPAEGGAAEREGLLGSAEYWMRGCHADEEACRILIEAMGSFLASVRRAGASARSLSALRSDLATAGLLVFCGGRPRGAAVLDLFLDGGPSAVDFGREISHSPGSVRRFRSTCEAFAAYLHESGVEDSRGEGRRGRPPRR